MIQQLIALVRMQQLDDIITEKEVIKKRLPLQLEELEKNVISAQAGADEVKKTLDKNIKERDRVDLEIKTNNEQMAKFENQLPLIKTNKEYKALNDEILFIKDKNNTLDDKLIELMEAEQNIRALYAERKSKLDQYQTEMKEKEDMLRKRIVAVEREIDKTKEKRTKIAKTLPIELIKRYANLIIHKNRKAVVFVNTSNGCGGCGFSIRPQLIIDITRKDTIVSCESCGRMIIDKAVAQEYQDIEV